MSIENLLKCARGCFHLTSIFIYKWHVWSLYHSDVFQYSRREKRSLKNASQLSWYQLYRDWWHQKVLWWQPLVPLTTKLALWRLSVSCSVDRQLPYIFRSYFSSLKHLFSKYVFIRFCHERDSIMRVIFFNIQHVRQCLKMFPKHVLMCITVLRLGTLSRYCVCYATHEKFSN